MNFVSMEELYPTPFYTLCVEESAIIEEVPKARLVIKEEKKESQVNATLWDDTKKTP